MRRRARGRSFRSIVFPDGKVLTDPSNAELALAAGSPVNPERMEFDLVIVGAGPAGLSAAVYGASEGFSTLVVDEGGIGGQATSSSLIRNYLGFPRGVSGRRLAQQAYEQAWVFGANFAFMQTATGLRRERDELFVTLSDCGGVRARAVLLATGARYRRLGIPALEALNGAGVFYGGPTSEAPAMAGRDVYVLGGANSAGQAALHLARYARRVTLVARAQSLDAGMSHYLVRQVEATPKLQVRLGTEIVGGGGDGWLEQLVLRDRADGSEETVDADGLFLMIGARPHTEWLPAEVDRDTQGFVLTGTDLRGDDAWPLDRTSVSARDEHAGGLRGRRRSTRLREARGVRSRRGLGRDSAPPPAVRGRRAASARPPEGACRRDWTVTTPLVPGPCRVRSRRSPTLWRQTYGSMQQLS